VVTPDELTRLLEDCPYLYHMAMLNSWPLIREHGLLPTDRLLDLFEIDPTHRHELTTRRRPASVPIEHRVHGMAFVRDQIPMYDSHLERCLLDGLTPVDWHARLNERVFFWLTERRLEGMLCAGAYRDQEHIVLKLRTAQLIGDYRDRIELSPINSGCTRPYPHPRGRDTFLPIEAYPYSEWRRKRSRSEVVVELTIIGGVTNVVNYVDSVVARSCNGSSLRVIYPEAT
jgi:hypothetical protein